MAKASITSTRCRVCAHPERLTIDHLLATGSEFRGTGRRFGLSKDAIGRHWENHVSDQWKAAQKMGPYSSRDQLEKLCLKEGKSVVEAFRALYGGLQSMLVSCQETGSTATYLAVAREARATLNDISRLTGELLPHVQNLTVNNTFNSVAFLSEFGSALVDEFQDSPEAVARIHRLVQRRMTAALPAPSQVEGEVLHAA